MIKIKLSEQVQQDLLISAIEGGSNYWYFLGDDAHDVIDSVQKPNGKLAFVERMWKAIQAGKQIPIRDRENSADIIGYICTDSIEEGEQLMVDKYGKHFGDILSDNMDSITADVWFQLAVMKEVVYG